MQWQVTVTTIRCEYVGDLATIMVEPDGTSRCAYVNRHSKSKHGKKKLMSCKWPDCELVVEFGKKALTL